MMTRNILKVYLFAVAAAVVTFSASDAFKLPIEVKVKDNGDPWMERKSYGESEREQGEAINAIPLSSRRLLKYPDSSGDIGEGGQDLKRNAPVVISFRNLDGESEDRLVSYETETPNRLERFYKHSDHPESAPGERIIFPNEDTSSDRIATRINGNDGDLRTPSRSKENTPCQDRLFTPEGSPIPNEASKKAQEQQQYVHSLETLAQIVRHLLFRTPVSPVYDSVTETVPGRRSDNAHEYYYEPTEISESASAPESSTSTELDVKEQSLYNGPKLRSSDCPEGYKRTRNGSCQKPSRRLLTFSR